MTILKHIENIDTTLNVNNAPVDPDNSTNKDADNSRNSSWLSFLYKSKLATLGSEEQIIFTRSFKLGVNIPQNMSSHQNY